MHLDLLNAQNNGLYQKRRVYGPISWVLWTSRSEPEAYMSCLRVGDLFPGGCSEAFWLNDCVDGPALCLNSVTSRLSSSNVTNEKVVQGLKVSRLALEGGS